MRVVVCKAMFFMFTEHLVSNNVFKSVVNIFNWNSHLHGIRLCCQQCAMPFHCGKKGILICIRRRAYILCLEAKPCISVLCQVLRMRCKLLLLSRRYHSITAVERESNKI